MFPSELRDCFTLKWTTDRRAQTDCVVYVGADIQRLKYGHAGIHLEAA